MDNTKLFLEVDASSIDIKQMLKKDFLELSMRAISSANPNRNNSWFTKESMEKSIGSFINKPILGYFENGDFVSHNGEWNHDSEIGTDYWDTLGKKGERILGMIRESDEVKIVEDDKGLSWVVFSCCLWTQYSFKQVKRLIKDAKRAQMTGGATKNISVEVDITDYEYLENGVMKINAFNLVGVTILGSRNGVKVEPGIEDAELSLVDFMGRDLYEKQTHDLRLAYEKLDDSSKTQKMEEEKGMNKEEMQKEESSVVEENKIAENFEKPEEAKEAENKSEVKENESSDECAVCNEKEEDQSGSEEGDDKENKEDLEKACAEDGEGEEGKPECCEDENKNLEEDNQGEVKQDECGNCGQLEENNDEAKPEQECGQAFESNETPTVEEAPVEEKESSVNFEEEVKAVTEKYESTLAELEELKKKFEEVSSKVAEYEKKDFLANAKELLMNAEVGETEINSYMSACEKGDIKSVEDLKVKIALNLFETKLNAGKEVVNNVVENIEAPINQPDVNSAFAEKETKKVKKNCWDALHEYVGK